MSCRRCGGKLFHTLGPAAMKLRSPKLLCVRGTKHVLTAAERSGRRSVSVTSWMSSGTHVSDPLATGAPDMQSCGYSAITSNKSIIHNTKLLSAAITYSTCEVLVTLIVAREAVVWVK